MVIIWRGRKRRKKKERRWWRMHTAHPPSSFFLHERGRGKAPFICGCSRISKTPSFHLEMGESE